MTHAIQCVNQVVHRLVNCLNSTYSPLDVLEYGWKLEDDIPVPIWFEGDELPSKDEIDRLSSEDSEMSQSPHDVRMKSLTYVPQENIPNRERNSVCW